MSPIAGSRESIGVDATRKTRPVAGQEQSAVRTDTQTRPFPTEIACGLPPTVDRLPDLVPARIDPGHRAVEAVRHPDAAEADRDAGRAAADRDRGRDGVRRRVDPDDGAIPPVGHPDRPVADRHRVRPVSDRGRRGHEVPGRIDAGDGVAVRVARPHAHPRRSRGWRGLLPVSMLRNDFFPQDRDAASAPPSAATQTPSRPAATLARAQAGSPPGDGRRPAATTSKRGSILISSG